MHTALAQGGTEPRRRMAGSGSHSVLIKQAIVSDYLHAIAECMHRSSQTHTAGPRQIQTCAWVHSAYMEPW